MNIEEQNKIETYAQAASRSIACMTEGRQVSFPLTVTVSDPQGLIARLRVFADAHSEVLAVGGEPWDPDAPTFPVSIHAIDAAGRKFAQLMHEDLSPIAAMNGMYVRPVIEEVYFLLDVERTQPFAIRRGLLRWTLNASAEFDEPPSLCALCGETLEEYLGWEPPVTIVRGGKREWDWAVLMMSASRKLASDQIEDTGRFRA